MKNVATITFATLLLGLAACSDSGETETSSTEAPTVGESTSAMESTEPAADTSQMNSADNSSATATDDSTTGSISSDSAMASNVPDVAVDACLDAVQQQAGASETDVIGTEFSEANSVVTVGVGAEKTPWRCLVSNDGQVSDVTSETN